jgi:hypothetical protein
MVHLIWSPDELIVILGRFSALDMQQNWPGRCELARPVCLNLWLPRPCENRPSRFRNRLGRFACSKPTTTRFDRDLDGIFDRKLEGYDLKLFSIGIRTPPLYI